jgi:hypothetical protein
MVDMEFDDEGFAIAGPFPISVVRIDMWKGDRTPVPTVESAVCDVCGGWASQLWTTAMTTTRDDSLTDVRISRKTKVIVYACPDHSDKVEDALVDEFGSAFNRDDLDELARKVSEGHAACRD